MNKPVITRVILYVKDVAKAAAFYERHFGMRPLAGGTNKWVELESAGGGGAIALQDPARNSISISSRGMKES